MFLEFKSWVVLESDQKFSCLMAYFDAPEIIKWAKKHIKEKDVFEKEGFEADSHVTILYGFHTNNYKDVEKLLKNTKPFEVTLGKISKFKTNPNFDVLKTEVKSKELFKFCKTLDFTSNFDEYKPHCTLAYVKKDRCEEFIGEDIFNDKKFKINELTFSTPDRVKTKIKLEQHP